MGRAQLLAAPPPARQSSGSLNAGTTTEAKLSSSAGEQLSVLFPRICMAGEQHSKEDKHPAAIVLPGIHQHCSRQPDSPLLGKYCTPQRTSAAFAGSKWLKTQPTPHFVSPTNSQAASTRVRPQRASKNRDRSSDSLNGMDGELLSSSPCSKRTRGSSTKRPSQ